MYLVIGNSPKKVELKDLNDSVYYKQQKIYSDEQYRRSNDLQHAINKGFLVVLKKSEDKVGSFDAPVITAPSEVVISESASDTHKIDFLIERIQKLEEDLKQKNHSQESELLKLLLDRIDKLESGRIPVESSASLLSIYEALKKLEDKIQERSSSDSILEKLEKIINRVGVGSLKNIVEKEDLVVNEEVYIPSIFVEDANSHIKLQVRTVENSDNVSDSLKKLKELKSKSK